MYFNKLGKIISNDILYDSAYIREKINALKIIYKQRMIKSNEVIAIALPRTEILIISILSLMESNITFLPIDLNMPMDRIQFMLDNAKVVKIITVSDIKNSILEKYQNIFIDKIDESKTSNETNLHLKNDTAYILYTSGTTGVPKAVEVKNLGFENFISAIPKIIDFSSDDIIACITNYTFDIFFLESVLALYQGLTVVLFNETEQNNPKRIEELIIKHRINMLQITPSRLKLLHIQNPKLEFMKSIKTVMVGGEQFPIESLKVLQKNTNAKIYNMYGPTETTIWSTISDLTNKGEIDIGTPIENTTIYLLSDKLEKIPDSEIGEICIGGLGLAKGYLNDTNQTDEHFCELPFEPYQRIYRTGDIGKYNANNELICLGRKDLQVKINGHRIELEDIDSNLMKIVNIDLSVTCFDSDFEDLIAFVKAKDEIDSVAIKKDLKKLLPDYMIPNKVIEVDEFSYTSSGKIDRKRMLSKWKESNEDFLKKEFNCTDDKEKMALNIIQRTLNDYSIKENTRLSDLTINSIDFIVIVVELEKLFDIEFEDEELGINHFETISSMIKYTINLANKKA